MSDEPESAPRPLTIVVAGTYQQFRQWCHANERSPMDRRTVAIVDHHDAEKMYGIEGPMRGGNARLVRVGTWEDLFGLDHIRSIALSRGFEWP